MAFFSVVIPTANRGRWLEHGLRALKEQTFSDFEVIVSDNGDENARAIYEKYADERFKYIKCKQKGLTANWEYALPKATGQYIGYIQDKMFFYNDALERVYKYIMEANRPDTIAYYLDVYDINVKDSCTENCSGILSFQDPSIKGWKFVDSLRTLLDKISWNKYTMSTKLTVGNGCIMVGFLRNTLIERVINKYDSFFDCIFPDFGGAILPLYESKNNIEIMEHLAVYIPLEKTSGAQMTQYPSKLKEFIKLSGKEHIMKFAVVPDYCVSNSNVATADYNYIVKKIPELTDLRCNKLNALIAIALEKKQLREIVSANEEAKYLNVLSELNEHERAFYDLTITRYPPNEGDLRLIKKCKDVDEIIVRPTKEDCQINALSDLLAFCQKYKEIYCYGAGSIGCFVCRCLVMFGINVSGYVITDRSGNNVINGIPVYSIDDVDFSSGSKGVVLTLGATWHRDVIKNLINKGCRENDIYEKIVYRVVRNFIK